MAIAMPTESTALTTYSWSERAAIAKVAAATELVPKSYRGKYEDCLIAMQYGAEINLPPMSALQSIAVIGGKPGLYGDGFLGVVMAAPAYRGHKEYYVTANGEEVSWLSPADLANDQTRAIAAFYRRGIDAPFVAEFSIADAKRARLWNRDGPWKEYPQRMLKFRAREYAARDGFAPELRGIVIRELLEAETDIIEAPPIVAPVRRSAKIAAEPPIGIVYDATPEPPAPEPMPEPIDLPPEEPPAPTPRRQVPDVTPTKPAPPIRQIKPEVTAADSVVVTDTAYIQNRGEEPYYEVRARVSAEGK